MHVHVDVTANETVGVIVHAQEDDADDETLDAHADRKHENKNKHEHMNVARCALLCMLLCDVRS